MALTEYLNQVYTRRKFIVDTTKYITSLIGVGSILNGDGNSAYADEKIWSDRGENHVQAWLNQRNRSDVTGAMQFDIDSRTFSVAKHGSGTIYQEKIHLPIGIEIEILIDRYMKIWDSHGLDMVIENMQVGRLQSDCVLVALNPDKIKNNEVELWYTIGDGGTNLGSLNHVLNDIIAPSLYNQEFSSKTSRIKIGDKSLTVRGPNREGDYELTSGKSSIIYHPNDGSLTLAKGFNTNGAKSTILSGNVLEGQLVCKDVYAGRGYQIYKLWIQFDNTDPKRSYKAELIENNTK